MVLKISNTFFLLLYMSNKKSKKKLNKSRKIEKRSLKICGIRLNNSQGHKKQK